VLGIQFARLFDADDLWYRLGRQANAAAVRLARGLTELGVPPLPAEANQVFVELPSDAVERLSREAAFHVWSRGPERSLIRLVCSWATDDAAVDGLLAGVRRALAMQAG
jgi:threonine aldolase